MDSPYLSATKARGSEGSLIGHSDLVAFADDVVNLHREDVKEYREQVMRLRDELAAHIAEHSDYSLIKMLQSGSVAKGTALSTLNDMDVAVYIKASDAPVDESELLNWLVGRLRDAYPRMSPDQFNPDGHCVTVSFKGTGLDVDVVPVIYEGGSNDIGYLIEKDSGDRLLTSIPLHLEFIRKRKEAYPTHFAQVVRLLKWWVKERKKSNQAFRFKSFMIELLCAHLSDSGMDFSDYPLAMEKFFAYVVQSGLKKRISFSDYYAPSSLLGPTGAPIEIFDPVNPENNVAARYSEAERNLIVEASYDALDALNAAHHSTTKERSVDLWQEVLGPSFGG